MKVRLLRALCFGGERKEPGTEIDLAYPHLVREMIFTGKAEAVVEQAPPSGPMITDSVPAIVRGKALKGKSNVGQ